jgi:CshA-type fibril repeat protein
VILPRSLRRPASAGLPRRPASARLVAALVAVAALVWVPLLWAPPAHALGEDGDFDLPLAKGDIPVLSQAATHIPLSSLVSEKDAEDIDPSSARLSIPEDLGSSQRAAMAVADDDLSVNVTDQGTWSVQGTDLVFTPVSSFHGAPSSIAVSLASTHDSRSRPAALHFSAAPERENSVRAPAGQTVDVPLQDMHDSSIDSVHLLLDGLPSGSVVTDDGRRLIIPDEGLWTITDGDTAHFTPTTGNLGRPPSTVHFAAVDAHGAPVAGGTTTVRTPVIPSMVRSQPFGTPIDFSFGDDARDIEPSTLRLVPYESAPGMKQSDDGRVVEIPGQGTWKVDRDALTVRFVPQDKSVEATAPMGLTGADKDGRTAGIARLATGYPVMAGQQRAVTPDDPVRFDALVPSRDIRPNSLRLTDADLPEHAKLSKDGHTLAIPSVGTWTVDTETSSVTFDPDPDLAAGETSTVGLTVDGAYADTSATATLSTVATSDLPTARDDDLRTEPDHEVSVDLLANDTPGAPAEPFDPATVQLRSVYAANLDDLEDWSGNRLVVPGEGTYTVGTDGVLMFRPDDGFVGRTTPIQYVVTDSSGTPAAATVSIQVDPQYKFPVASDAQTGGINSLLNGLMPKSPSSMLGYVAIFVVVLYAGATSLWIGGRMETDRRTWKD